MPSDVPSGWVESHVGKHVLALKAGVSVNSEVRLLGDGEIGVLKTSCLAEGRFNASEHKTVISDDIGRVSTNPVAGSILVSRMNTIGLVGASAFVPETRNDLFLPDRLWRIDFQLPSLVEPLWLSYVLVSPSVREELRIRATGTSGSMKNLSKVAFLGLPILLPPLPEQKKIAAILSSVDEAIEASQAVIEQTRRVKEGLLQELLTRGIGHTRFKQTPIGEIPEGWEVRQLGEVTSNLDGRRIPVKAEDRKKRRGTYPYYGASGVIDTIDDFIFQGPNLLVAEDGFNLLRRATPIAFVVDGQYWVNNHAHVLGAKPGTSLAFLAAFFQRVDIAPYLTGFEMPKLNAKTLMKIRVPVPSHEEQNAIAGRLDALDKAEREGNNQTTQLQNLKSGLLQDLLTGKKRVTV